MALRCNYKDVQHKRRTPLCFSNLLYETRDNFVVNKWCVTFWEAAESVNISKSAFMF